METEICYTLSVADPQMMVCTNMNIRSPECFHNRIFEIQSNRAPQGPDDYSSKQTSTETKFIEITTRTKVLCT